MRKRQGNGKGPDIMFGYLIPMFFMALAGYQQVTSGAVDKYVLGGLFLFGLAALGYRVDVLLERYFISRSGGEQPPMDQGQGQGQVPDQTDEPK